VDELSEIIKKAVYNKALEIQHDRSDGIHVTDLTTCLRRSYYIKKHGFPMNEKLAYWLLFGQVIHDMVEKEIAEYYNGKAEMQGYIKWDNVKVHATCDVLTDQYVIEIKTCNRIPYKPYDNHREQLNAYLHIFNRQIGKLVYISRSQLQSHVFTIQPEYTLFVETMQKAVVLDQALKNNKPPRCNLSLDQRKFYCRDCPYKDKCTDDANDNGIY